MTEPQTEGGKYLAQALLRDVVHPKTGYDPQTDATDTDPGPVRATDPTQARGGGAPVRTEHDEALKAWREMLFDSLRPGRNLGRY